MQQRIPRHRGRSLPADSSHHPPPTLQFHCNRLGRQRSVWQVLRASSQCRDGDGPIVAWTEGSKDPQLTFSAMAIPRAFARAKENSPIHLNPRATGEGELSALQMPFA